MKHEWRTIDLVGGFRSMVKSKLLVLNPSGDSHLNRLLLTQGYDVHSAETPQDAVFCVLESDPQIVIWSNELDEQSDWQRVKTILESRTPLISLSKEQWENPSMSNRGDNDFEMDEGIGDVYDLQSDQRRAGTPSSLLNQLDQLSAQIQGKKTHLYTKIGNKLRRIQLNDIRFIEVEGKYSAIQLSERQYHVKASLKDLVLILGSEDFVRVSRNFVVNLQHIDHIDMFQGSIHVAGKDIPVSRTYKENLMRFVRLI